MGGGGGGGLSWERQNRGETENIGQRSEHSSGGLLVAFPPPPTCGALSEAKKLYNYKRVRGWTSAESHRVKRTRKLNPGTK